MVIVPLAVGAEGDAAGLVAHSEGAEVLSFVCRPTRTESLLRRLEKKLSRLFGSSPDSVYPLSACNCGTLCRTQGEDRCSGRRIDTACAVGPRRRARWGPLGQEQGV